MKELILMRHAKSDWGDPGLDDHDRPLNSRGVRDAPRMGRALAERGARPGLLVSSTATRARETARLVAHELGHAEWAVQPEDSLYLASADEILQVIGCLDESCGSAILFGHNPGMHEASWRLARPGDAEDLGDFPTAAAALFRLPWEHWADAAFGEGELAAYLFPRQLGSAG